MGKDSYALVTGLFMAALIAAIVVIAIWLGDVQHQTRTYVAETRASVTGLKAGSTVYYRGIAVGKVSAVYFEADNPGVIVVPMELDDDVRLSQTLEFQGVTGLTKIALNDNGDYSKLLPKHARIPIKPSLIDRLSASGEDTVVEVHELVKRLNGLLDENNVHHITQILANVEAATARFNGLQDQVGKTLALMPALSADARRTMTEVNGLTQEFTQLSRQMRQEMTILSKQSGQLMQTGTSVGQQLLQTTLPRANTLMTQMQATTRRFARLASTLETQPQAFLLGADALEPEPGEADFKESP
jgi:phospholipid/cholesterol/gamma-HCH transport system substrate-binding protein